MTYGSVDDLPDRVRGSWPRPVQEIYHAVYNDAYANHRLPDGQDEHRRAWADEVARHAVRRAYHEAHHG